MKLLCSCSHKAPVAKRNDKTGFSPENLSRLKKEAGKRRDKPIKVPAGNFPSVILSASTIKQAKEKDGILNYNE